MSTQKHTDGPWHITKETKFHTMGTFITVRDSRDGVIAGTHVNDKANAHLIAAAPDLLEALRWFADELPSIIRTHCPLGVPMSASKAHNIACAAIAKAEGRAEP